MKKSGGVEVGVTIFSLERTGGGKGKGEVRRTSRNLKRTRKGGEPTVSRGDSLESPEPLPKAECAGAIRKEKTFTLRQAVKKGEKKKKEGKGSLNGYPLLQKKRTGRKHAK